MRRCPQVSAELQEAAAATDALFAQLSFYQGGRRSESEVCDGTAPLAARHLACSAMTSLPCAALTCAALPGLT